MWCLELKSRKTKRRKITINNELKDILPPALSQWLRAGGDEDFKLLINGLFQAEGHVGGYFETQDSATFNPLVYISLNASKESIALFKKFNNAFNNKLNYVVSENKSGIWHIRIYSKSWELIINQWIPYFDSVYGDKKEVYNS